MKKVLLTMIMAAFVGGIAACTDRNSGVTVPAPTNKDKPASTTDFPKERMPPPVQNPGK
jgi:hypothetical protein